MSDTFHAVYSPFAGYYETGGGGAGFTVDDGWLSYQPSSALPRPEPWRVRIGSAPGEAHQIVLVVVSSGRVQFGSYAVLDSAGTQLVEGVRGGQPQHGTMWYPVDQMEAFAAAHGLAFSVDQGRSPRQLLDRFPLLDNDIHAEARADRVAPIVAATLGALLIAIGVARTGEALGWRLLWVVLGVAVLVGTRWFWQQLAGPATGEGPPLPHQYPPRPLPGEDPDEQHDEQVDGVTDGQPDKD